MADYTVVNGTEAQIDEEAERAGWAAKVSAAGVQIGV